jgi:hypothetical protein
LALAPLAAAQNTGGRTDGPEGSELGQGGYTSEGGGKFSLGLQWGASLQETQPLSGAGGTAPLFVGVTGAYWADDILLLEMAGQYLLNNNRVNLMVGPKVRTGFWPISLYLGLKAGAILIPNAGLRFGLSPEVGADILIRRKAMLGLGYAADFAIGGTGTNHRIYMSFGWRF